MLKSTTALLCGSTMLVAVNAFAQTSPPQVQPAVPVAAGASTPLYDPAQLPTYRGQVQVFTVTPRGDIDGFVLADGTEVKTPPHLSTEIAFGFKPGDAVTIHGLKAASLPLIQASSITNDASGKTVIDNGPEGPGHGPGPLPPPAGEPQPSLQAAAQPTVQGRVRMALHGPRGDVNGALLDDGTVLRLPPPEAARMAALLAPGQTIVAAGPLRVTSLGRLLDATALGTSADQMLPVGQPAGKHGRKGPPPA